MTAKEIQDSRAKLGLTQREFGKLVNVSHTTVRRWEKDEATPTDLQKAILKRLRDNPEHPYILVGLAEDGEYGTLMEILFGEGNPLMA